MYPRATDDWGITAWQDGPNTDPDVMVQMYGSLGLFDCECGWSAPCHFQYHGIAYCPDCNSITTWRGGKYGLGAIVQW